MNKSSANRGFVKTIILIVVILIVISYFGLNLRTILNSPTFKDNFAVAYQYAKIPVEYVWNKLILPLLQDKTDLQAPPGTASSTN